MGSEAASHKGCALSYRGSYIRVTCNSRVTSVWLILRESYTVTVTLPPYISPLFLYVTVTLS